MTASAAAPALALASLVARDPVLGSLPFTCAGGRAHQPRPLAGHRSPGALALRGGGWRQAVPVRAPQDTAVAAGSRGTTRLWLLLPAAALVACAAFAATPLLSQATAAATAAVAADGRWNSVVVAKFLAAGGLGASISHAIAVPLDVVKTRQQHDPSRYVHSGTGKALGIVDTGVRIAREEGVGMLLQGLRPTGIGYLIQGATKYTLWEFFKAVLGMATAATALRRVGILITSSLLAEVVASAVLCPFERARIKLVSDPTFASGTLSAFARLVREDGFYKGLYGNAGPTLFKQITYTIGKLTTFSLIFDLLMGDAFRMSRPVVTLLASLVAGFAASVVSQPGDMLQICTSSNSLLAAQCPIDLKTGRPPGFWKLMVMLGPRALFTGWPARLLQIQVIVVTQLLIYDSIKLTLGL